MDNYKAQTTLNEKDSLQDMLTLEKALVKMYSTAITEGVSNGFRIEVFFQMTDHGYYKVESAPEEDLQQQREKFSEIKNQLC